MKDSTCRDIETTQTKLLWAELDCGVDFQKHNCDKMKTSYRMHETGFFDFNPINHFLNQLKQSHDECTLKGLPRNTFAKPWSFNFFHLVKVVSGSKTELPINISLVVYGFRSQGQYQLVQGDIILGGKIRRQKLTKDKNICQ